MPSWWSFTFREREDRSRTIWLVGSARCPVRTGVLQPADAEISEKMVRGQKVTLLEVSGTYQSGGMGPMSRGVSKPGYRMLGAIIDTTQGPWFFKLTGPVQTVEKWSDSWTQFVDSLRITG